LPCPIAVSRNTAEQFLGSRPPRLLNTSVYDVASQVRGRGRLWSHHSRVVVRRFLYCRDPLFLGSCTLYVLNRWLLKPHLHSVFLRSHFNDLLLIPCALPPVLLIHRWLGLRSAQRMPRLSEIAFHLALWCVLFEFVGPRFMPGATGDLWDIAAYCLGGTIAAWWWRRGEIDRAHETYEF